MTFDLRFVSSFARSSAQAAKVADGRRVQPAADDSEASVLATELAAQVQYEASELAAKVRRKAS